MKHIRKFNETKKEDKVKDQEVLFNAEVLIDDEKPSFKTSEEEDQEKIKKEFDKLLKVKSFENFTIEVDVEIKPEHESEESNTHSFEHESDDQEEMQHVGCGCCDECSGQEDCQCCQDCTCGSEVQEVEQTNPNTGVKVMNIDDFMKSLIG